MQRALLSMALAVGWRACAWGQTNVASEVPQRLVKLSIAATDAKGEPVTDLRTTEINVLEDGRPAPVIFFRFAGRTRQVAAFGTGEFANRPGAAPTVILLDRWNERMTTTSGAWVEISRALQHLESGDGIYIYFLTNQGELFPVHPVPFMDSDVRLAAQSSPAQLAANLDDAVRKLPGFRPHSAQDWEIRANKTFQALDWLSVQMASIPGRKSLI